MAIYSELNIEHNGEGVVSIRFTVLELETCKSEKLPISGNFGLRHLITGSNFDLGSKNAQPLASNHREQSVSFSAKFYDACFGNAKGGSHPPPCAAEDGEMASAGEG